MSSKKYIKEYEKKYLKRKGEIRELYKKASKNTFKNGEILFRVLNYKEGWENE